MNAIEFVEKLKEKCEKYDSCCYCPFYSEKSEHNVCKIKDVTGANPLYVEKNTSTLEPIKVDTPDGYPKTVN